MKKVSLDSVEIDGEVFLKLGNSDLMRPFFMSIVSNSNHWMFISSNGGLTAGRVNAEQALFPYYTDDKVTELAEFSGSKTILQVSRNNDILLWEPFSIRNADKYKITRNLYKNQYGNKIRFEAINHDLGLNYTYEWSSSNKYGFVRTSLLTNIGENSVTVKILDGIQNVIPAGVPSDLQKTGSNLVNAYKRTELDKKSGLGIFALSSIIVDKAEPSEALKSNVVWSQGFDNPIHLLSSLQLNKFRSQEVVHSEEDIKGEKGAYFLVSDVELSSHDSKEWNIIANVNQNHAQVVKLISEINGDKFLMDKVSRNVELGTEGLLKLVGSADGLLHTKDQRNNVRHFSNVLFNIMRGGVFDHNYDIEKGNFIKYIHQSNKGIFEEYNEELNALPEKFSLIDLQSIIKSANNPTFIRLATEYLPIKFSRRHGDPSRPWNKFSINTYNELDGSKILDYEGNWRDIFQNWEALALSFPDFINGMIFRFVNASTFDGYNPYRINKDGFDWEIIEPDDPWSYIGYWGDHQIIYLLKFLEFIEDHNPGKLNEYLNAEIFVYADVPYRIKPYSDIVKNPKDTIDFDEDDDKTIRKAIRRLGADGALLKDSNGNIHRVSFTEKLLASLLAKASNFVPQGGIWMNTQRPEWNDANNALVGNGVSMVTLYYMRRFVQFLLDLFKSSESSSYSLSEEMLQFFIEISSVFGRDVRDADDIDRRKILDQLGTAASDYRTKIYNGSFSGKKVSVSNQEIQALFKNLLTHIDATISLNRRDDGLYHAYNLLIIESEHAKVSNLNEMLEGQVAVLSSGVLASKEVLKVLDALKESAMFRHDQYSYMLYPNKALPGFLAKNIIPPMQVEKSELLMKLLEDGNIEIINKDINGAYHYNGNFRNVSDLNEALDQLDVKYKSLVDDDHTLLNQMFESVFDHKSFTGRSGTFYGYEGLGSIYWHMVSKLLLAVEECALSAIENGEEPVIIGRLLEHFYEINEGIGVHKSPQLYGAFPTDPYSHTPAQKGAQQPGMTGQVKEDIITRFGELGAITKNGMLTFNPCLLRKSEFTDSLSTFSYIDVFGEKRDIALATTSLGFTFCQVPVVYTITEGNSKIIVHYRSGKEKIIDGNSLDRSDSDLIFKRTGEVIMIEVHIKQQVLK